MRKTLLPSLLISLTTTLAAYAGTFTSDFNSGLPAGTAVYGSALVDTIGGVGNSGCLKMTSNAASQNAGFIINDLESGAAIDAFTATFQIVLGSASGTPADGFSFNYAGDVPDGTIDEEGAPVTSGLTVEFDTFTNNATSDLVGIDVKWNGTEIATHPMTPAALCTWPNYASVLIQLTTNGTLNLNYNGINLYTNLVISGFVPTAGRFGLGARTGSSTENCFVDNLSISTTPILHPIVLSHSPTGTNVSPTPVLTVNLWDGLLSQVDQSTIQMMLDGTNVTATVTQNGSETTIQYPAPSLPSGSSNYVVLTFADNGTPAVRQTNVFGFIVATFPTIPPTYMATADTAQPGFTERIFQGGTATVTTTETADAMLAGLLYDTTSGQPFPNTAQPNFDSTWTFLQPGVLNYNIFSPTNVTSAGDFANDLVYPGLPGTNGSLVNFAYEAVTYLFLTPGAYTFGVNSDDGFRLTSLDMQLGVFDAGRGAADTIFYFAVTQPGYYPFRLVHFQGTGAGSLEWFSEDSMGQKILINDSGSAGYIPAYARATTTLPYFLVESPAGTGNRADKPIQVEIQDGVGVRVNTNTIHLRVNGGAVTPSITQTGGVTTVQYSTTWASGSANTAMVWFADNEVSPVSQTNQFTFNVSVFNSIPASYAISAGAVDTTKPGCLQKVFQTDRLVPATIANAETMLAGQLVDPAGNPLPNKAAVNTDGSYNYAQANTINYNIAAPATAGDFPGDVLFPGIPGPSGSTTNFALEGITYLFLPVGYYVLGVNSDDGFRLTTSPNPHEEFPFQLAVFDGTRAAGDTTTAGFGITNAGYYPFRLVYFQATGPASLELFAADYNGVRTIVNDTSNPASLRAYRSANNTLPYVQWAYPYRAGSYSLAAGIPVYFTLVDGTPAVQQGTIQMKFNNTTVSPTITPMNGTNIVVSYLPTSFQQVTNTTATVQLVWADASGHFNTNAFTFTFYGSETLAPLWSLAPGSRSYLTNDFSGVALEAGMAYNPVTSHLIVGSLVNSTTLRGFYVLDSLTGNDLRQLPQTNSSGVNVFSPMASGVNYPGYSIGVADDGAIYAASRQKDSSQKYAIYRWASETSPVSVAYGPTTVGTPNPFGYDFRVRGAGTSTQIIVGQGNSATPGSFALLFTTANGSTFSFSAFGPIAGNSDYYGSIAFGTTGTCYAGGFPATALEYVNYSNKTTLASYPLAAQAGLSFGPLGVDLVNGRAIMLGTSTTAGTSHGVNLFELSALTTSANNPTNTFFTGNTNANPGGSGSVAITPTGAFAYVLDSQNGITAYELSLKSAAVGSGATTSSISAGPGSNYTIKYSGGQAVNYVLLKSVAANAAMSTWTPVATNSGTLSSSNFVVTPSGARTFYRVNSRGN
jgi:hypothetical protein